MPFKIKVWRIEQAQFSGFKFQFLYSNFVLQSPISVFCSFPFLYCVSLFLHFKITIFGLHIYSCVVHFPKGLQMFSLYMDLLFAHFLFILSFFSYFPTTYKTKEKNCLFYFSLYTNTFIYFLFTKSACVLPYNKRGVLSKILSG
jgi:hypothetical protein